MYKALCTAEPLAKSAAHQHVACIGDKCYKCYFGIAGVLTYEGNGGNSPAEVLLSRLVRKPWNTESPDVRQIIPREKATAKYPNPMGIPSCKPWRKAAASLEALLVYTESIFLVEFCIIIHHNNHKKIQKTKKSKYNNAKCWKIYP